MAEKNEEKKGGAFGAFIGTVVLAAASVTAGWVAHDMLPKGSRGPTGPMKRAALRVAVTNAEMRVYNLPERYVAHAEPMQEVPLVPEIEGYVKEILFKEGALVKEGQVLYRLDEERYAAVVNQRKADLEAAEAESRRAERYFKRMETADARGITQLERDNAEAAAEKAKASVLQARANLTVAEYYMKRTVITAPISGQIGKTTAHLGDYISPSKGALAKIVQIDPIRVRYPMTDRAFMELRRAMLDGKAPGYRLRLVLPNDVEYGHTGELDFDDNEMSDSTASISVRAKFPNPERMLVPNSYLTLLADYTTPPKYLAVPQQCLIELAGGSQGLWIVKDDMTVEQRVVKTRETFEGWTPIVEGVKPGERVVLSGTGKLAVGAKVAFASPTSNDDINPNHVPPIKE